MNAKDLAKKDYEKGATYKAISEKYDIPVNTLKSWRNRHGWKRNADAKSNAGAPKGSANAKGNKGGAAPKGNKNAEKHGFFSRYLPADALEIMQEIEEKSPADILWEQITLQYTAIIRAQKLMYVKDQQDKTVEIVSSSDMRTSWDIQQAWEKQEKFLSAQSRAMAALNGLIAQYEKMLHSEDDAKERAERLEKLRLESARIKAETDRINADKGSGIGSVIFAGEGDLID